MSLPSFIRACLWSFDPKDIDVKRDKTLIITQVLNYGHWNGVRWLFKTYSKSDIRNVLRHPGRGSWWPDVLNFWLLMFNMRLSRGVQFRAILSVDPLQAAKR